MRKKKLMALSLVLVIIQIVSLLAIVPASAASQGRSYTIYKSNVAPTADGGVTQGEAWDNVPWSENFVKTNAKNGTYHDDFSAKFKAMWVDSETTTDLWIYLYVTDTVVAGNSATTGHGWLNDYFCVSVDSNMDGSVASGSNELHSGYRAEIWDIVKNGKVTNWASNVLLQNSTFSVNDKRLDGGYYSAEICIPITKTAIANDQIKFDILVNDCVNDLTGTSDGYSRMSWNGDMNDTSAVGKGIGTFSNIPAAAVGKVTYDPYGAKEYTIYNAGTTISVDGNAANDSVWENAEWGYLTRTSSTNVAGQLAEQEGFSPKFKAMWYKDGQNAYLYLLIDVNDNRDPHLQSWLTDGFQFAIDETAEQTVRTTNNQHVINCSTAFLFADTDSNGNEKPRTGLALDLDYQYIRDENGYTIEAVYQFVDAENCNGNVRFDLFVQDSWEQTGDSGNCYARYSYGGIYDVSLPITNGAIGILSPYTSPADEPISTEAGAGTRLTAPAGLRFESRVNKAKYDAAIASGAQITTGTLIVPTDYLTEYGINNSNFTKKNLDLLGVNYLDVVNDGWAKEVNGEYVYYGSIVGIKTQNLDRNFSGIGYMTVKNGDDVYTVYSGYRAADHSRSVQYVATAAIASGEYNDYLTVLQSFIKNSAPERAEGTTYRVMQYNLLRDNPTDPQYAHQKWGGQNLEIPNLRSNMRVNITSAIIEGYAPDILVVNERFNDTWANLGLSDKYTAFNDNNTENTNAIVYNNEVFELIEEASGVAFYTYPDGVNKRNVTYAILEDKVTGQKIAVFATHWSTDGEYQPDEVSEMKNCISNVLDGDYANIPVIILGDFNTAGGNVENYNDLASDYTDFAPSVTSVDHIIGKGFESVAEGIDTHSYTKFASDHKPIYADIAIVEIGG